MKGVASRGNTLAHGDFGIIAMEPCWIRSNQIEAARIAINRHFRREGKVWINIFPDKPVTTKPIGVRMGSGKGSVEYWVAVVKPGRVLFEVSNVTEEKAREALRLATHKLPLKCKIVSKADLEGGK
jgi:large subunit ribosomal protein L16